MKKLSIYNTYVVMESQEQCDRMKQLCIDNWLPIWEADFAFDFDNVDNNDCFSYAKDTEEFFIYPISGNEEEIINKIKVTEQEFIELLKNK